ncbi:MAG TPA: RNA polymerase-associated protein RapA [Gammaproteobacteria bacterium]
MPDFFPGQRWISDTEADLGLGTVMAVDGRTVTILFLASGETRTYARASAPLSRVRFNKGDVVASHEGWTLSVEQVEERDGLLTYLGKNGAGERVALPEGQLDNFLQFSKPQERLFASKIDADRWFFLRHETLGHAHRLAQSPVAGLCGARTSLIPHQLYIAHEVAGRHAPRVLLADEVGLGKTIEAGLILHQQLFTGMARRVLVVVPAALLYQWFVEMWRRFNLRFALFDEERCKSLEAEGDNPFLSEQLVLCSLGFLRNNPQRHQQALAGNWDVLVVDEAHHLHWSEQESSPEYRLIEALAAHTRGVLLLTATPEQLGAAAHFARLRLLDPHRFHDLPQFLAEAAEYAPVAEAAAQLADGLPLDAAAQATLQQALHDRRNLALLEQLVAGQGSDDELAAARRQLIDQLIDRHGTGRVLFRNTRSAIKGFPRRHLHAHPLPLPPAYGEALVALRVDEAWRERMKGELGLPWPRSALLPELCYRTVTAGSEQKPWWQFDPRVQWLVSTLERLRDEKVLVICAHIETVFDLEQALRMRSGAQTALFHEELSILERDRAAAWFADEEYGAQVLLCSEIGSEGRNFQFAHHLILFDLPLNPDLLEQRIGRLDRIGQRHEIHIHVTYLLGCAQELMFHWFHEGLNAFTQTCPVGAAIFDEQREALLLALAEHQAGSLLEHGLIASTHARFLELSAALQKGRDRLLELNSFREERAKEIGAAIAAQEQGGVLADYMEQIFDLFGVEVEEHGSNSWLIRPGNHMVMPSFPELPDEGCIATYDRATALAHEDMQFLTWEHPMVQGAMDLILSQELGNSAATIVKHRALKPGTLLLEALFVLSVAAPKESRIERYFPPTVIRVIVDHQLNELGGKLGKELLAGECLTCDRATAAKVLRSQRALLEKMVAHSEVLALQPLSALVEASSAQMLLALKLEIDRLRALQEVNPTVRDDEIDYLKERALDLDGYIQTAQLRLDALRVIIAT